MGCTVSKRKQEPFKIINKKKLLSTVKSAIMLFLFDPVAVKAK
jgi:hypothetical protein